MTKCNLGNRGGNDVSETMILLPSSVSLFLMEYPDEAIDYVIVHELSHILHHDHSKHFWANVAHYMPDYKRRRALLKQ